MKVKVKLFALYRERAGTNELWLDLPEGASVQDALNSLAQRFPSLEELLGRAFFALNKRYVQLQDPLKEGDELAVFPPVSGGVDNCWRFYYHLFQPGRSWER